MEDPRLTAPNLVKQDENHRDELWLKYWANSGSASLRVPLPWLWDTFSGTFPHGSGSAEFRVTRVSRKLSQNSRHNPPSQS